MGISSFRSGLLILIFSRKSLPQKPIIWEIIRKNNLPYKYSWQTPKCREACRYCYSIIANIYNLFYCKIDLYGTDFYIGDPDMIMPCLVCSMHTLPVWLRIRNWHITGRLTYPMSRQTILLDTRIHYLSDTAVSYVEKHVENQANIRLASHLVRSPNS